MALLEEDHGHRPENNYTKGNSEGKSFNVMINVGHFLAQITYAFNAGGHEASDNLGLRVQFKSFQREITLLPVSYTHLDVYKRQTEHRKCTAGMDKYTVPMPLNIICLFTCYDGN